MLSWAARTTLYGERKVRFFYQDETGLGLKTISSRKITAKEVKPKGKVQQKTLMMKSSVLNMIPFEM